MKIRGGYIPKMGSSNAKRDSWENGALCLYHFLRRNYEPDTDRFSYVDEDFCKNCKDNCFDCEHYKMASF